MLTEIDFDEMLYDTTYRKFNPDKEAYIIRHKLQQQSPSELGVIFYDGVVTRASKSEYWWEITEDTNTQERFPHKYAKLNAKVQEKISTIQDSQKDNTRQAMFTVYKTFMDFVRENDYASCDELLLTLDASTLDIKVIMSLLMASNPIKSRLSYRQQFYKSVAERSYMIDSFEQVRELFERLK